MDRDADIRTWDRMADLGFGVPNYGIQDGTGDPSIVSFAHDFVRIVAAVAPLRNICQIASLLPIPAGVQRFRLKQHEMVNARLSLGTSRKDIFAHLIGEDTESGERFTRDQLTSNAELVIVAGTDTTATVLTELFKELAIRREVQRKLYEEIVETVGEEVGLDVNNVKTMPYLQAVIDEIMRLWTPLPSGLQHQTGPDGAWVDGIFVPPNTAFRVPHMALMKDERYFPRGREFWPERWIEEGGVKEPKAFVPFS
jgi:cytochrome P450